MNDFILFGAVVNAAAAALGALIGLLIQYFVKKRANKVAGGTAISEKAEPHPEDPTEKPKPFSYRFGKAMIKGFALCTLYIGMSGALKCENDLVMILSMVFGICIGEFLNLDYRVNRGALWVENRMKGRFGNIAQGLVSASLLFCVGAMTINGSILSGLGQGHALLISKSVLDFCAAVVYASTMGIGVLFSAAFVLVIEGGLTLLAALFGSFLTPYMISMISSVGSLLIIGLGLNLLGAPKLKIMNYIPAVFMPILLCLFIK